MNIFEELQKLRRHHYECEDCFYSCPKCSEGSYDERKSAECDCGADKYNVILDRIIEHLKSNINQ